MRGELLTHRCSATYCMHPLYVPPCGHLRRAYMPEDSFDASHAVLCQNMVFVLCVASFWFPHQAGYDLQVGTVSTALEAAPITDALATQASRGLVYSKGPVAYSIAGSHESDSSLIPAANTQWLQDEHSRSSLATSVA